MGTESSQSSPLGRGRFSADYIAFLQERALVHESAHGGVRGRSHKTSAEQHNHERFIWLRDVGDCFISISRDTLKRELKRQGFRRDVLTLLSRCMTPRGHVTPGLPIANDAANLVFFRLDETISALASELRGKYSRLTDDFVFSCNDRRAGAKFDAVLRKHLLENGLALNEAKSRDIDRRQTPDDCAVHGVVLSRYDT